MSRMKPREPGSPHEALADFFETIGVKRAAAFEDVQPSTIYNELNPDLPGAISYGRVARLTAHFGCSIAAEDLARRAGGIFMVLPAPDTATRWGELTADAAEDMGQVTAQIVRALSPHSPGGEAVVAAEARKLLPEIYELMRHLSDLMSLAKAAAESDDHDRG